jgi:hypothetical protein
MTAISTQDLFITLLGKTEGRDKLLKASGGLARVACHFTGNKQHEALFKSVSDGRSLMRLLLWFSNIQKMAPIASAGGPTPADWLSFLRIFLDLGFCVCDNVVYFSKPGVMKLDAPKVALQGVRFMCLGFLCAILLDIWALMTLPSDRVEEKAKRTRKLLGNLCDFVASLNGSNWVKSLQLNHLVLGSLAFTSAAIACVDNWEALPKTKKDDKKDEKKKE